MTTNLAKPALEKTTISPRPGRSIRLEELSKSWDETTALNGIDLDIEAGKFTALLGPSGCGKSTALRLISGLEHPSSGRVFIADQDVTEKPPAARDIAMVFQSYALFPHLSVAENIIFGLKVRKVGRADRDAKLHHAADMLGLSHLLDRKPSQLSGGQQQRVALGRAIVANKSIFLMDEPLSNLDAKLRAEMRDEIRSLQRKFGMTMVYVTHDQVEAVTMADEVILMNAGRIEQKAPPRMMYDHPETLFAARFIGTPPMSTFDPVALGIEPTHGVTVGVRPEDFKVASDGLINARVSNVEFLGADALIECEIASQTLLCRVQGQTKLAEGNHISLTFDQKDMHLFDASTQARIDVLPSEFEALFPPQKPAQKRANS